MQHHTSPTMSCATYGIPNNNIGYKNFKSENIRNNQNTLQQKKRFMHLKKQNTRDEHYGDQNNEKDEAEDINDQYKKNLLSYQMIES